MVKMPKIDRQHLGVFKLDRAVVKIENKGVQARARAERPDGPLRP